MATLPAAQRIRISLENAIVEGQFRPGDRIDPDQIARDYGCSRTPVRDALQALEASGLLVVQPKRGTFVTKLDAGELMHRFEVMAEMEAASARLATRRAEPEDVAAMEAALTACRAAAEAGDVDGYYAQNTEFHQAIYHATHNPFLEAETLRLQAMLQPYRRRQLRANGRMLTSRDEHEQIFAAIRGGDSEEAGRLMRGHVIIQSDRFHDLMRVLAAFDS